MLLMKFTNDEDYQLLEYFLSRPHSHLNQSISSILLSVPDLVLYLQQNICNSTESMCNNAQNISTLARKFKDKFTEANIKLLVYFPIASVAGVILTYGRELLQKVPSDIPSVVNIADKLIWHEAWALNADSFGDQANLQYHSITMQRLALRTAIFNIMKNKYPDTQSVFGIIFEYQHLTDTQLCDPKFQWQSDEILKLVYDWNNIFGYQVTELQPFSKYTGDAVINGRWSVIPTTNWTVPGSITKSNEGTMASPMLQI